MAAATGRAPVSQDSQVSYSENAQPTAAHEEQKGQEDRTLVGNSVSKSFDDTTAFTSEGRVITSKYHIPIEDELIFQDVHPNEERIHSIEAILSRAVKLDTIVFKSTQSTGALLTSPSFDVMNTIRSAPGFALARTKIANFYGIRFTAKLRVTLNPQPFESGMFQIFFIPVGRTFPPLVDVTSSAIKDECKLPFSTSCPNVLCNISTQSEVELVIPYTGSSPYLPLASSAADFGQFYIQSIVPISDGTNAATCDLSVYMSLHDVILFGASSANGMTSSTGARPQMMQPPANEADLKSGNGPISRIAKSILPLLNELGLSAPSANPNPERVSLAPYANLAHSDSVKNSFKLSLLSGHTLQQAPLGIDQVDEMDIKHYLSKPTYFNQFSWSTGDPENKRLILYDVEPDIFIYQSQDPDFLVVAPTRLRYLANCFRFWRGTIRYFFHVVANKFHSGRLRFVYDCGSYGGTTPLEDFPQTFTHVVDIRDATNFVLDCPYFGIAPWRRVYHDLDPTSGYQPSALEQSSNFYDHACSLRVFVENELRAPDSAAQKLQIVVMVAGGDDFEFAAPIAPTAYPTTQYSKPTVRTVSEEAAGVASVINNTGILDYSVLAKGKSVEAAPSRDYNTDAARLTQILGMSVSAEHLRRWNETDYGPDDLGPYAYVKDNFGKIADIQAYFPNFQRYYQALEHVKLKEMRSTTGAVPQALDFVPINMVGPSPPVSSSFAPHKYTVGEKIGNIRQLIKRYQMVTSVELTNTVGLNTYAFTLMPYYFPQPVDDKTMSADYLSYFSSLYRFYRGSLRFMISGADPANLFTIKFDPSYTAEVTIDDSAVYSYRLGMYKITGWDAGKTFDNLKTAVTQPFSVNLQGALEVEIPYYSRFHKLGFRTYTQKTPLPYYQDMERDYLPAGQAFIQLCSSASVAGNISFKMFRSAGDDYNLGYLLGPPLCRVRIALK